MKENEIFKRDLPLFNTHTPRKAYGLHGPLVGMEQSNLSHSHFPCPMFKGLFKLALPSKNENSFSRYSMKAWEKRTLTEISRCATPATRKAYGENRHIVGTVCYDN